MLKREERKRENERSLRERDMFKREKPARRAMSCTNRASYRRLNLILACAAIT
jgi:hypothetical protein